MSSSHIGSECTGVSEPSAATELTSGTGGLSSSVFSAGTPPRTTSTTPQVQSHAAAGQQKTPAGQSPANSPGTGSTPMTKKVSFSDRFSSFFKDLVGKKGEANSPQVQAPPGEAKQAVPTTTPTSSGTAGGQPLAGTAAAEVSNHSNITGGAAQKHVDPQLGAVGNTPNEGTVPSPSRRQTLLHNLALLDNSTARRRHKLLAVADLLEKERGKARLRSYVSSWLTTSSTAVPVASSPKTAGSPRPAVPALNLSPRTSVPPTGVKAANEQGEEEQDRVDFDVEEEEDTLDKAIRLRLVDFYDRYDPLRAPTEEALANLLSLGIPEHALFHYLQAKYGLLPSTAAMSPSPSKRGSCRVEAETDEAGHPQQDSAILDPETWDPEWNEALAPFVPSAEFEAMVWSNSTKSPAGRFRRLQVPGSHTTPGMRRHRTLGVGSRALSDSFDGPLTSTSTGLTPTVGAVEPVGQGIGSPSSLALSPGLESLVPPADKVQVFLFQGTMATINHTKQYVALPPLEDSGNIYGLPAEIYQADDDPPAVPDANPNRPFATPKQWSRRKDQRNPLAYKIALDRLKHATTGGTGSSVSIEPPTHAVGHGWDSDDSLGERGLCHYNVREDL